MRRLSGVARPFRCTLIGAPVKLVLPFFAAQSYSLLGLR